MTPEDWAAETENYGLVTVSVDIVVHKSHPLLHKNRMRRQDSTNELVHALSSLRRGDDSRIAGARVVRRHRYPRFRLDYWGTHFYETFFRNHAFDVMKHSIDATVEAKRAARHGSSDSSSPTPATEPVSISVA